jgi:hypothetical protein
MMKLLRAAILLSLLWFCTGARAQINCTLTPNVGFQVPNIGATATWGPCLNGDLNTLDTLLGGLSTLTPTSTAPSVLNATNWLTANTSPVTITNFANGFPGQLIRLVCGPTDTFTQVVASANITLGSAAWSCARSTSLNLLLIGTVWTEVARTVSVSREVIRVPAASCDGVNSTTVAGAGWSKSASGVSLCRGGTSNQGGYASITDTAATFQQFFIPIPLDCTLISPPAGQPCAVNPYIRFAIATQDATVGHTIIPQIRVACAIGDGTTTDDVGWSAAHALPAVTLTGVANALWTTSNVQLNSTDMSGCVAGGLMWIQVGRSTDTATGTGSAEFYIALVTMLHFNNTQQAN